MQGRGGPPQGTQGGHFGGGMPGFNPGGMGMQQQGQQQMMGGPQQGGMMGGMSGAMQPGFAGMQGGRGMQQPLMMQQQQQQQQPMNMNMGMQGMQGMQGGSGPRPPQGGPGMQPGGMQGGMPGAMPMPTPLPMMQQQGMMGMGQAGNQAGMAGGPSGPMQMPMQAQQQMGMQQGGGVQMGMHQGLPGPMGMQMQGGGMQRPQPISNMGPPGMQQQPQQQQQQPARTAPRPPSAPPPLPTGPIPITRGGTGYKAPGSQSAAHNAKEIKNDYCQQFVDTGARPQNYLRDSILTDRYEEYPKIRDLVRAKDAMVAAVNTPAYFLKADLRTLPLSPDTFGTKFDVILVDPPWEEYVRRAPHAVGMKDREVWTWQDIQALDIGAIADNPSFCFLWCGTAEALDAGRHCLAKWGFRRVEDIVWVKTNKDRNPRTGYLQAVNQEPFSVLTHTKEHCLMGLKGSVKRNQDGHFIHANVDTDVIVSEEPAGGSTEKPTEMYEIIERFCLGRRRLELFGEERNIRDGWVTVGRSLPTSNFRPEVYAQHFRLPDGRVYVENMSGGRVPRQCPILVPVPPEVEESRPKSPPPGQGRR